MRLCHDTGAFVFLVYSVIHNRQKLTKPFRMIFGKRP